MSQKFHINKHGVPAPCHAKKGKCPLGGDSGEENHFNSEEEATAYVAETNESQYGFLPGVDSGGNEHESYEVNKEVFDKAFQDSYDSSGYQVNGISNRDIEDDPEIKEGLKDVVNAVNEKYPNESTWVLVKEKNLDNFISWDMDGHSDGKPVTSEELLERSNLSINGERFYVSTQRDLSYKADGGGFAMDESNFKNTFKDSYVSNGEVVTGVSKADLGDSETAQNIKNYVNSEYPNKENFVLVKESNLKDFNKHNLKKSRKNAGDLIKESGLYINGERFYVADSNDLK